MSKPVKVKVCGITRTEDAQAALELDYDYIGINRYAPSPRCVPDPEVSALLTPIPQGKRVVVDVAPTVERLEQYVGEGFDFLQIHADLELMGRMAPQWAEAVGKGRLWLAPKLPPGEPLDGELLECADTFLIDAYRKDLFGGTGKTADWGRFASLLKYFPEKRWILAGGLAPGNVAQALAASGAICIDVNSGVESAPGIKDPEKMRAILQAIGR